MRRAVILAEPGSGSTTFVALLYSTLVRAAVEREEVLRFVVAPESLGLLTEMYSQLMSGEPPATPPPDETSTMRVTLAFPGRSRRRSWLGREASFSDVPKVECRWVRARFDQIETSLRGGNPSVDPRASLTECTIPIFLLSGAGFEGDASPGGPTGVSPDVSVRSILQGLARPLEVQRRSGGEVLRPIFVFTRLDRYSAKTLGHFGLKFPLNDAQLEQDHLRLSSAFRREFLPRTDEYCLSAGSAVGPAEAFFSFLLTESVDGGETRIKVQSTADHRQEPVYALRELDSLIRYLGELST